MAAKIIHIDSYIGRWGYSKELLRYDLDGTQKDGAVLRVSSLGGDVFHALDRLARTRPDDTASGAGRDPRIRERNDKTAALLNSEPPTRTLQ